ncbi:GIN domain-containing protein [Pseudonocardia acidicola]|uniref:DUF2807 domain-containing protein n=1 Tax=Pseudonocardia acidicola TaxID=2724939 RepID=A0ABX1S8G7_9PSEU|nr:DUF2807 domain-containing protein [Pseudonocardia acidicola]NMH97851.1 DUF2807 domain-containing protein [Pseudonocardia acidicola]
MSLAHRPVGSALRGGVTVAVVLLLLAGCQQSWTGGNGGAGGNGADGTGGAPGAPGSPGTDAGPADPPTGSGHPVAVHVPVPGVTTLVVEAGFTVHVHIGEPEQAIVRMDDNVTGMVEARVDGARLRLGLRPGAAVREATLSAEVTVRHLDQVTAGGASQVRFDSDLIGDNLLLTAAGKSEIGGPIRMTRTQAGVSGASRLALSGQVGRLQVAASGASELTLSALAVTDLDATLSGASHADTAVSGTLAGEVSGASSLRYRGSPRTVRRQVTGASSIDQVR